jgi:ABC-2 type transport system ATP-binding protein
MAAVSQGPGRRCLAVVDVPAVETAELTRRFGRATVVDRLCLTVPQRSVYGFLGPNGAGKTTTIRLLLGLLRPHAGTVRFWGEGLRTGRDSILRRVGALVETPSLYPHLTGSENLEVTRRLLGAPRAQVGAALEIVGLASDGAKLVRAYSLGMRQRLGVALALLGAPELLILDEPTNGLDPAGIGEMRALIRSLAADRGLTVFLSSHLLSEVEQVATHVGIVRAGGLVFQGTLADLRERAAAGECLMVQVDDPVRAARLLADAGWRVRVPRGAAAGEIAIDGQDVRRAADVNRQLVEGGVAVSHLSARRPALEEIFFELTGHGRGTGGAGGDGGGGGVFAKRGDAA